MVFKRHFKQYFSYVVAGFGLAALVVVGAGCLGGCGSSYHVVTTKTAPLKKNRKFMPFIVTDIYIIIVCHYSEGGRHGRDRVVVGLATACAIGACHH